MFDIGMVELLVIGIVALIVIGPKDLPGLFHNIGRFTARARSMAREFSRAMEDAAKESGVDGVARDLRDVTNPRKMGMNKLSDAAKSFEEWDPLKSKPEQPKDSKVGPFTQALSEERAEAARKIRENTAKVANERIAREKAEAAATEEAAKPAPKKAPSKKPAASKAATAKKPAASKATTTKAATKKPAAKKASAKKPAAKKTTAKTTKSKTTGTSGT